MNQGDTFELKCFGIIKMKQEDKMIYFDSFLWKIYSKLKSSSKTTQFQQNCIFEQCSAEQMSTSVNLPFS